MLMFLQLLIGSVFMIIALALVVLGVLSFFDLGFLTGFYSIAPPWFFLVMSLAIAFPIAWLGIVFLKTREIA